jgi:ribonuclease P protein component
MNSPADNYGLFQKKKNFSKSEIIRGYNSYRDVIKSSKSKINGKLKVLYNIKKSGIEDNYSIPRIIISPKVGFLISKKLFSKAVTRNKAKRQLKESYRNLKLRYIEKYKPCHQIEIIFSLSASGSDYLNKHGKLDFAEVKKNMNILLDKIFQETVRYN